MELPQLWQPLTEALMNSWHRNLLLVHTELLPSRLVLMNFALLLPFFSPQLEVFDLSICVITLHPVENAGLHLLVVCKVSLTDLCSILSSIYL